MARASFRVHLVTHHDGMLTGRLLSADGATDEAPTGYGVDEDQVFAQLALALEEKHSESARYLWRDTIRVAKVRVSVHPQKIIKRRHVIARERIELEIGYAWTPLGAGTFRVIVPRFGWWFVLEDIDMAAAVIKQAVSAAMLGEQPRSLYEFRVHAGERIVEWSPTLSRGTDVGAEERARSRTPTLHAVAEDLVEHDRGGRKRPIVGDLAFEPVHPFVLRESPRSLLVVGHRGSGKSTWIRGLARHLSKLKSGKHEDVPRIWGTSADRIVAGMVYLGMWEQRCLDLIDELSVERDYLYVDQLTALMIPRTGHSSIADMFLPAMLADDVSLIAECTPDEYERFASQSPAMAGMFHVVRVEPQPSSAMPALLQSYQARTNDTLRIEPDGLRRLVLHLEFFQRDIGFPGKGFRFLDWLNQESDPPRAAAGEDETRSLGAEAISEAFARSSGLPLELISDAHMASREVIAERLEAGVVGQDEACLTAARVLTRFKAGLNDPERPVGSLFFVGPTGVGKTELAKQLARYMFGKDDRMIRLDMSEYMLPGSAQRMLAVGPGRHSLVERVRQAPLSLILLDEIEKAHAEVFDLLLAMLGEGRMTDAGGRLADFRMTLIVMTSNLGVRQSAAPGFGGKGQSGGDFVRAVRDHFRPEFFNRIDHVVPFRNLAPEDILAIVDLELAKASKRAGLVRRNLRLEVHPRVRDALAKLGWHPSRGARPLKRVIEERIVSPLAVVLAQDRKLENRRVHLVLAGGELERELASAGEIVVAIEATVAP